MLDDDRDLKQIIEDFNDKNYWGYYFIKYPEILKECTNFWIWAYGYTIRVLTGKLTNSYHVEYYTYSLFIMLQKQFQNLSDEKLDYEWVKAYGEIPYVLIDGNKITFIQTNDNKYCWMIDDKQIGEIFDPCLPDRDVLPPIVDKVYEIARSIL